jgi:hypothetical protein
MLSTSAAAACIWSLILVRAALSRGRLDYSLYKPPTRKRFPKSTWTQILCTAGCIKLWRLFVSAAISDLTTIIRQYFAVFN